MARFLIVVVSLLTLSSVFCVNAQTTSQTPSCQSLTGMTNINASLVAGSWFEKIRTPAKNISCVRINVPAVNNQTQLNITIMYSASSNGLLMDQIASGLLDVNTINSINGFNVTYNKGNTVTTFKMLSTDYISNAVLCGYTNLNDQSTSFGIIVTRMQVVNESWLMQLKYNASKVLPMFNSTLAVNITQSLKCRTNTAVSNVPAFALLLTAFCALLKLAH